MLSSLAKLLSSLGQTAQQFGQQFGQTAEQFGPKFSSLTKLLTKLLSSLVKLLTKLLGSLVWNSIFFCGCCSFFMCVQYVFFCFLKNKQIQTEENLATNNFLPVQFSSIDC